MERSRVFLSVQRALLGVITLNIKGIAVHFKDAPLIVRVYFEEQPSEDELELLDNASTEILADFNELSDVVIESVVSTERVNSLPCLDGWVYLRYEKE